MLKSQELQDLIRTEVNKAYNSFEAGNMTQDKMLGVLSAYGAVANEANFRSGELCKYLNDLRGKVYGTRKSGEPVARQVADLVNGGSKYELNRFVAQMENEHRTLQQSFTGLCMHWIKNLAQRQHYDGRNEASVKLAKKIVQEIPEDQWYLPLI